MNLKKLAGSGSRDTEAICVHAWRDKEFIWRELQIINPDIVLTCSTLANRLFYWIVKGDAFSDPPIDSELRSKIWQNDPFHVLPVNHPSVRPGQKTDPPKEKPFDRVLRLVQDYKSLLPAPSASRLVREATDEVTGDG